MDLILVRFNFQYHFWIRRSQANTSHYQDAYAPIELEKKNNQFPTDLKPLSFHSDPIPTNYDFLVFWKK